MDVPDCSAARKFLSEQIQNTGSKVICLGLIDDINNLTGLVGPPPTSPEGMYLFCDFYILALICKCTL